MLGICSICGRPAMHTCSLCGRMVCGEHYDPRSGLCSSCAAKTHRRPDPRDDVPRR